MGRQDTGTSYRLAIKFFYLSLELLMKLIKFIFLDAVLENLHKFRRILLHGNDDK